jgi:hypothetical protein
MMLQILSAAVAAVLCTAGAALAVLAYRMLKNLPRPREPILEVVSQYILLAGTLVAIGGVWGALMLWPKAGASGPTFSAEQWEALVDSSRRRFSPGSTAEQAEGGELKQNQSANLSMRIEPGRCKVYLAKTPPPGELEVSLASEYGLRHAPKLVEPHLAIGQLCRDGGTADALVVLTMRMIKAGGPYALEMYPQK